MARSTNKKNSGASQAKIARIKHANDIARKKATALVRLGLIEPGTTKKITASTKTGTKGLSGSQRYLRRKVNAIFADIGSNQVNSNYKLKPKSERSKLIKNPTTEQLKALSKAGYKPVKKTGGKVFYIEPDKTITKKGTIKLKRKGYSARVVQLSGDIIGRDENNPKLLRILRKIYTDQINAGRPGQIGIYFGVNEGNVHNILVKNTPEEMYEYLVLHYEDSVLEKIDGLVVLTYDQTVQKSKETGAHIVHAIPRKSKYKPTNQLSDRQRENRRLKSRIRYAHKKAQKNAAKPKPTEK